MRLSDAGMDIHTWAQMLGEFSATNLPSTISQLIEDVARNQGEFTLAPAGGVLVARDPIRMNELMSYPRLAKNVILRASPPVAILSSNCDLQMLLSELGDRGFSSVVVNTLEGQKDG